jgi:acyl-CoA synthetase (AMP-forming)/AMP-acid ligase II/acyl carrier protein
MSKHDHNSSWVHLLRQRAEELPDQVPFTFLVDGEQQEATLTYRQLDMQSRAIAARLQAMNLGGERALLLYPPGLDFIAGLFGCWYAGVTAIPAYPPRSAQHSVALATLKGIARDASPAVVLTSDRLVEVMNAAKIVDAPVIATTQLGEADASDWREPNVSGESLACLQYTSGSTTAPKGVMLTHANLFHNSRIIQECFGNTPRSHGVIWLPPYHDMGLIGGILQVPYTGCRVTLMAPASFLQKPLRWLSAISRLGATTSGGPDFAYALCIDRVAEADRKSLDLSSWQVAFNGAEPIHPETLERFTEAFAPCGFRREAFYPCYGLAEATLFVSGGDKSALPIIKQAPSGKMLVGCGKAHPAGAVKIVDPETKLPCEPLEEGEVWLARHGTPEAYWQKPAETEETFNAHLSSGEGPFMRSGDLGFLDGDELYITGRLKDLIIIRGVNHYPQDIEQTVQSSHAAFRPGCGAAFAVNGDGYDRLVVVQEVHRTERDAPTEPLIRAIRESITQNHGVDVASIVLLKPGQILKTSSGKIRRAACRQAVVDGMFESIARWDLPSNQPSQAVEDSPIEQNGSCEQIQATLTQLLARTVNLSPEEIDPADSFARYGIDSAGAASLTSELSTILGREITLTMIYDYPSIQDLARYLAGGPGKVA